MKDLKEFFGVGENDGLQSITGSMSVGGFVGVLRGHSHLASGKAGMLVKVATEVDKKNTLEDLKRMVLASYGGDIMDLFGDKFGNIDGVGAVGGVVGTATEFANVGMSASDETSFWNPVVDVLKDIFGSRGLTEGYLQGAGIVSGWSAGGLVGKLSNKAKIEGGTTALLVRGEIYAGGVVGFMDGDGESHIRGVKNYSIFNVNTNGVIALSGDTIKIIDDAMSKDDDEDLTTGEETGDGTTEDDETDIMSIVKTSLGGLVGYYTGQGEIKNTGMDPMPVLGLSVDADIVLDKYFAGGYIGHLHNADLTSNLISVPTDSKDVKLQVIGGTLSYAGTLVGRISGKASIDVNTKKITAGLLEKFRTNALGAVKGAGGLVGAITSNSKFAAGGDITFEPSKVTLNMPTNFGATLSAMSVGGAVGAVLDDSELVLGCDFKVDGSLNTPFEKGYSGGLVGIVKGKITGNGHTISADGYPFGAERDERNQIDMDTVKETTIGGVAGVLDSGEIVNVKNTISIEAGHKSTVGGIVGLLAGGKILDCQNSASLSLISKNDNGTRGSASNTTPWSQVSSKGNSTNVYGQDGKPIKSYKIFKDAGYDKGSIGGIAGKSTKFALSTILTTTDFSSIDKFVSTAEIKNCEVNGAVRGFYFYGNDSEKIEDRSVAGDEVHTTHIADKRGQYIGSVDKLSNVDMGDAEVKRESVASFDLKQLTSAEGIIKLLSTNVDDLVKTTLSADYIYATSAQWKDRNKEIDDESLKEKAYVVGYKLLTKFHTFSQVNDKTVESVQDKYTIYLKKSVSNDIKHITTLEEGRQFNPITEGYTEQYECGEAEPSEKLIKTHAQIKALEDCLTNQTDNGAVVVDVTDNIKFKSGSFFSNKDEKGPNEDYEEYMFTTITCELTTLSVFVGGKYEAMQYCGGDIEMTRNARYKKGFMSDQAQKALLLDVLYKMNDTAYLTILEALDSDFKIHSTLLG